MMQLFSVSRQSYRFHGKVAVILLSAIAGGCGSLSGPAEVTPESFYARRQGPADAPEQPYDRSGPLQYQRTHLNPPPVEPPKSPGDVALNQAVSQAVASNDAGPTTTTAPSAAITSPDAGATPTTLAATSSDDTSTRPTTMAAGQYMVLGTTVAEVNGTPIFANKVIALVLPQLKAEAKRLDAVRFRGAALPLLLNGINALIKDELEFAAAEHNLDDEAKNIANGATAVWKKQKITQAGGSEELARRKAAANGDDFDEMVEQHHRSVLVQIYYLRKVVPKIEIPPVMMRQYYQKNLDTEFTQHGHVKFWLIKIDPGRTPDGRPGALAKIRGIHDRAVAGEDFAGLAKAFNDGPFSSAPIDIDKGAFIYEDVEKAAFNAQPGQMTEIIETKGSFFLAKVVEKTEGKVQPFESPDVQRRIHDALFSAQFEVLREAELAKLQKDAPDHIDKESVEATLEMVMENYPVWSKKS